MSLSPSILTIREATKLDEPEVVRVIKGVYDSLDWAWEPDGYHSDLYDLETYYFAAGNSFWVAVENGNVVGTVALEIFMMTEADADLPTALTVRKDGYVRVVGADCSVERLYVDLAHRRKGIASKLMEIVMTAARLKGCMGMEVWTDKNLPEAHLLYEKLGATTVGERLCDDPAQSPEWGMFLVVQK